MSYRPRLLSLLLTSFTVALIVLGTAVNARSSHGQNPNQAQDLGPTPAAEVVNASVILKVQKPDDLEAIAAAVQDPDSSKFHRFVSLDEFVNRFAPNSSDIDKIRRYLKQFGIAVTDVYPNHLLLRISGTVDAFDKAFDLDVHDFAKGQRHFHKPNRGPRIPEALRDILVTIVGPSTEPNFRPMNRHIASEALPVQRQPLTLPPAGAIASGVPGDYTVGDVANLYDINPLYQANIDGRGTTLGIVTLADFLPQDAYTYWNLIGLDVAQDRITQIHVDGGGVLSADAGSGETSLDVEQSGGLAPGARIRVFDAPNSAAGFMDAFYRSISENLVDTLSVSWGQAEELSLEPVVGVDRTPELIAFHQIFLEAGVQGISVFAASGDSGAFDINDAFNDPVDNVLTVDRPSADPAITAAGGTTTPVVISFQGVTPKLVVAKEQVWGWDYIENFLVQNVGPQFAHVLFPVGTGGGVSTFWRRPPYQAPTAGIRRTEPGQSIVFQGIDLLDLPANFPGRNVPDISLNADPFTGYIVFSTTDGGLIDGFGGTSFVAPQLNGVSALFTQATKGRVGFWNPMLYRFQRSNSRALQAGIVDIVGGDNWFYTGVKGYEPGAGLGVLDVAKLLNAVRLQGQSN